jgi:carbon starvation protein CstA
MYIFYVNIDGYVNKTLYQNLNNNLTTTNTNLLNGVMLIHPIVLYFFYGLYILEYKVNFKKINTQIKKIKSKKLNQKVFSNIFIIILIN